MEDTAAKAILFLFVFMIMGAITLIAAYPRWRRQSRERRQLASYPSRFELIPEPPPRPAEANRPEPPKVEPKVEAPAVAAEVKAESKSSEDESTIPPPLVYTPRGDLERVPILRTVNGWQTLDLTRPEDTVICGMKRHGKGNALQLIALEVLQAGPEHAALVVLDMKMGIDYAFVRGVAHGALFVADDAGASIPRDGSITDGLARIKLEMDRRSALLIESGARNLTEYNARATTPLPRLYVIADEVADFTPDQKAKAEGLARMGGAAGIVFFWATQRPEASVLSLQIQGNASRRLVFRLQFARDHYVSLRIPDGTKPAHDLTKITEPGVGVLRIDGGADHLGRVPEVRDDVRDITAKDIAQRWPRGEDVGFLPEAVVNDGGLLSKIVAILRAEGEDIEPVDVYRKLYPGQKPGGRRLQKIHDLWNEAEERVASASGRPV